MVVYLLIGLLAFLYFRGASLQANIQTTANAAQSKTAATGTQGTQSVTGDQTFNSVLNAITAGLNTVDKILDTSTQKN